MNSFILTSTLVLEGEELTPLYDGAVAVEKGDIVSVGARSDVVARHPGLDIIDAGDATLMPGMIDSHSHTSLDARLIGHLEMMNDPESELTIRAVKNARDNLMAGITACRILGEKHYVDVAVRRAINEGRIEGPHLLIAGIGMRAVHGHGFVGVPHTGPQELMRTCRENMLRRVDWLKVFVTAGAPPAPGQKHIPSFLSLEEIETVTAEANRMGIRTSAHCIGGEGLINCVKGGIDVIDHAYCATSEDLKLIEDNGRWICLTPGVFMDLERNTKNTPEVAKNTERGRERVVETMRLIVESGVKYAIGSDAMHAGLAAEAGFAAKLGVSARDALLGVTINGARLCGVDNLCGSIDRGKRADIIAVEGNPLHDLEALKRLSMVFKSGTRYR